MQHLTQHLRSIGVWTFVVALAVLLFAGGATASAQEDPPRGGNLIVPTEITGVVRIRGCTPDPSRIDLRAQPLRLGGPGIDEAPVDARATDLPARLAPTSDPHAFGFAIRGLQPVTQYRLAISLPPSPTCGKVFWRSSSQGFAVSGGRPVVIEGVAATTQLEILQPGTDLWVGADNLDFTDSSAATRRFRWRSSLEQVIGGELQISTTGFPIRGDFNACDEPDGGIVYRQQLSAPEGEWTDIGPVNFQPILSPRIVGPDGRSTAAGETNAINVTMRRLLQLGAPVYLRVVPMTADGPACDTESQGVPGWVLVAKVPIGAPVIPEPPPAPPILEPGAGHQYTPPYFFRGDYLTLHPTYDEIGYRVIKAHTLPSIALCDPAENVALYKAGFPYEELPAFSDPFACQLVVSGKLAPGLQLNVGDWFYYKMTFNAGGGGSAWSAFTDTFGSLVTGFVNAAGLLVTTLADVYNGVVDAVKVLAYDALLSIPIVAEVCDDYPAQCKKAIDVGMTYGMTAMGLPPSLPNWDELKDEGLEYLSHQVADELENETGIPSQLSEAALAELTQKIIDQLTDSRGGADPGYNWLMRYNGFNPASWMVAVKKNGVDPLSFPVTLQTHASLMFRGADVPLPQRFPPPSPGQDSRTLRVPFVLQPSLLAINAPLCRASWYTNPRMQCFGVLSPFAKPVCQYQTNTGPNSQWHDDLDCAIYGDMVAVYYRDAWVQDRVDETSCTTISGVTLAAIGNLAFPVPGLTFFVAGLVPPTVPVGWDWIFVNACGGPEPE